MKKRVTSLLVTTALAVALSGCAYLSRASESSTGTQADAFSHEASLSSDGRWLAFTSFSTNLVPGDTNGTYDVFVRDNRTKQLVRVSVANDGTQGNDRSETPSISNDGRRIAFASMASNFSAGDTNDIPDVFVHDRDADADGVFDEAGAITTTRMNPLTTELPGFGGSGQPAIYGDGTGVVYASGNVLSSDDTNPFGDIYVTELIAGVPVTTLISRAIGSTAPAVGTNRAPSVNLDGTVIVFTTETTDLLPNDTNEAPDVVVWDATGSPTGTPSLGRAIGTLQPDLGTDSPSVSSDATGRFIAFQSRSTNLVPGEEGTFADVFVLDRTTGVITAESRTPLGSGTDGHSLLPSISADGMRVSYWTLASDIVPGDTNGTDDVVVRDRATGLTQIASTSIVLQRGNDASRIPSLSADGRYVAFDSLATNFVTPDANGSATDVFTRAAIVPRIDTVSPALLTSGGHTLHITGAGFGPVVAVQLGSDVTIVAVQHTATQIDVDLTVANGATGTRDVVVLNLASPGIGGVESIQSCGRCVTIQ